MCKSRVGFKNQLNSHFQKMTWCAKTIGLGWKSAHGLNIASKWRGVPSTQFQGIAPFLCLNNTYRGDEEERFTPIQPRRVDQTVNSSYRYNHLISWLQSVITTSVMTEEDVIHAVNVGHSQQVKFLSSIQNSKRTAMLPCKVQTTSIFGAGNEPTNGHDIILSPVDSFSTIVPHKSRPCRAEDAAASASPPTCK